MCTISAQLDKPGKTEHVKVLKLYIIKQELKQESKNMRILVTYAVQGEFTELKFPGLTGEEEVQVGYLRTGIGKVKSAFYLTEAINRAQPDLVVNMGTAGTVRHQVGDIFVCRHFVDRDMQKLTDKGNGSGFTRLAEPLAGFRTGGVEVPFTGESAGRRH